jgi:hypothetical protein
MKEGQANTKRGKRASRRGRAQAGCRRSINLFRSVRMTAHDDEVEQQHHNRARRAEQQRATSPRAATENFQKSGRFPEPQPPHFSLFAHVARRTVRRRARARPRVCGCGEECSFTNSFDIFGLPGSWILATLRLLLKNYAVTHHSILFCRSNRRLTRRSFAPMATLNARRETLAATIHSAVYIIAALYVPITALYILPTHSHGHLIHGSHLFTPHALAVEMPFALTASGRHLLH